MGKRPATFHEAQLHDMELALQQAHKVAHVEGIRARLHEVPTKTVSHTPIHFERPEKGYSLPSLGMWHRWLESRLGEFLLNGVVHTLCLSCGMPVPVSNGEKTVWGTHDKKTVKAGKGNRVTVGALVKWTEETIAFHGVYNTESPTYMEIEEEKVVRLVTANGLGCSECVLHMAKVTGRELRSYESRMTEHTTKYAAWERSIAAYRAACYHAGITPDPNVVSNMGLATPPKAPTPYILVDPKNIEEEKTVRYWNPGYGVSRNYISSSAQLPTVSHTEQVERDTEIPYRFFAYCLAPSLLFTTVKHSYPEGELNPVVELPQRPLPVSPIPSRESLPKRIVIHLLPVGICHHARGVTPVVKAGRRPGVYE